MVWRKEQPLSTSYTEMLLPDGTVQVGMASCYIRRRSLQPRYSFTYEIEENFDFWLS